MHPYVCNWSAIVSSYLMYVCGGCTSSELPNSNAKYSTVTEHHIEVTWLSVSEDASVGLVWSFGSSVLWSSDACVTVLGHSDV